MREDEGIKRALVTAKLQAVAGALFDLGDIGEERITKEKAIESNRLMKGGGSFRSKGEQSCHRTHQLVSQ